MSYSFTKRGTKEVLRAQIAEECTRILKSQPEHKADVRAVEAAALALVEAQTPQDDQEIACEVYGSLSWFAKEPEMLGVISASTSIKAYCVPKGGTIPA